MPAAGKMANWDRPRGQTIIADSATVRQSKTPFNPATAAGRAALWRVRHSEDKAPYAETIELIGGLRGDRSRIEPS